jgi:hypothetical protein
MTNTPDITPPSELVQQWMAEFYGTVVAPGDTTTDIAARAAQWGADQELEACCAWLPQMSPWSGKDLRKHRRPKPPSLKEEALGGLDQLAVRLTEAGVAVDLDTIRRALEQLDD